MPFIFATGYGERAPIPEHLAAIPVIQKPYTQKTIEARAGATASDGAP